ncbi:MAG TPA: DUF3830 family protein [Solirubrobacteraceae bacterium]|jgi:hypothetical protein|nr:DUF3830 family protein [Solirubrobacteraceae bacterium]
MPRYIEIELERRQARCVAELLDAQAPRTCAALWDALPQGGDAFHGKYARNEIYTLVEDFAAAPPGRENSTITPIPGDVCAFWFTGQELGSASHGYSDDRRPAEDTSIVDLALFYERNNLLLNPDVGWVPGNVFATIVDGLDAIAAASADLWLNGAAGERLTLRRSER